GDGAAAGDAAQATALRRLDVLATQAAAVRRAAAAAVEAQRRRLDEARERTARIDLLLIAFALSASGAVGYLTVRSIKRPLHQWIDATRAVAAGRFGHQLPESDDELGTVAAAFNAMTRRLAALERLKRDFIVRASHDLRTPLVSMTETSDVLLAELAGPLAPQQRRLIELHRQGARRLLARVASLLDLSRIEGGIFSLELARHDLVALVRSVLDELGGRLRRRRLALDVTLPSVPVILRCDGDRIARVVENLLDNAIKLSSPGGRIGVEVAPRATPPARIRRRGRPAAGEAWVRLSVVDRGPGVAAADKERIFHTFYRAGDDGGTASGVGLGLAICRDVVTAHRGFIWVDDAPAGGSRFHVLLPRGHRPQPPETQP
ncbi:MAG: sensor histidine kinase, partial [Acidobacteria bacterium]